MNYNFKVTAELKEDLDDLEKRKAEASILELQKRLNLLQLETGEYVKPSSNKGLDGFGAVYAFYHELKRNKHWFSKLVYHNYYQDVTCQAV